MAESKSITAMTVRFILLILLGKPAGTFCTYLRKQNAKSIIGSPSEESNPGVYSGLRSISPSSWASYVLHPQCHRAPRAMGRGRPRCPKPTHATGLSGTPSTRRQLSAQGTERPHASADGIGPRGVFAAG